MAEALKLNETEANDWSGERDQILALYAQRYPISYIAQALGRSNGFISRILHSEFSERNANRQQIVLAHQQTLSWLVHKATKRIEAAGDKWDRRDAEHLLKLLEREARLFGLDQPTKIEAKVEYENVTSEEIVEQLASYGIQVTFPSLPPASPLLPEHVEEADYKVRAEPDDQG